ncbi:hypothetical protein C7A17_13020 [Ectopseudomonas mendocina]|uniref:Uncharacterized protein n=1 Tax=Ectopseudomonas mendocina TaxID=300 RepID=A0A2R3QPJ6_ECTME|nr:hypothetical protein C7A17_13020 [Pseudomonas mendocina]
MGGAVRGHDRDMQSRPPAGGNGCMALNGGVCLAERRNDGGQEQASIEALGLSPMSGKQKGEVAGVAEGCRVTAPEVSGGYRP